MQKKLLLWFSEEAVEDKKLRVKALANARAYVEKEPPGGSSSSFVAIEPPQFKKIANGLVGKAKGIITRHVPEAQLKIEWMTGTIYIKTPQDPRPMHLCSCYNGVWTISENRMLVASQQELTKVHFLEEMAR